VDNKVKGAIALGLTVLDCKFVGILRERSASKSACQIDLYGLFFSYQHVLKTVRKEKDVPKPKALANCNYISIPV
jgi:hypothetical protein